VGSTLEERDINIIGGFDGSNCINLNDAFGNGWTGLITTITSTYFEITFTQIGAGLDITSQMHTIQG